MSESKKRYFTSEMEKICKEAAQATDKYLAGEAVDIKEVGLSDIDRSWKQYSETITQLIGRAKEEGENKKSNNYSPEYDVICACLIKFCENMRYGAREAAFFAPYLVQIGGKEFLNVVNQNTNNKKLVEKIKQIISKIEISDGFFEINKNNKTIVINNFWEMSTLFVLLEEKKLPQVKVIDFTKLDWYSAGTHFIGRLKAVIINNPDLQTIKLPEMGVSNIFITTLANSLELYGASEELKVIIGNDNGRRVRAERTLIGFNKFKLAESDIRIQAIEITAHYLAGKIELDQYQQEVSSFLDQSGPEVRCVVVASCLIKFCSAVNKYTSQLMDFFRRYLLEITPENFANEISRQILFHPEWQPFPGEDGKKLFFDNLNVLIEKTISPRSPQPQVTVTQPISDLRDNLLLAINNFMKDPQRKIPDLSFVADGLEKDLWRRFFQSIKEGRNEEPFLRELEAMQEKYLLTKIIAEVHSSLAKTQQKLDNGFLTKSKDATKVVPANFQEMKSVFHLMASGEKSKLPQAQILDLSKVGEKYSEVVLYLLTRSTLLVKNNQQLKEIVLPNPAGDIKREQVDKDLKRIFSQIKITTSKVPSKPTFAPPKPPLEEKH
jgi:hypothetical protein